jgi:Plavaka transposase
MSAANINELFGLWAAKSLTCGDLPPFANAADLYGTIDSTPLGDVPWQNISLRYNNAPADGRIPDWMTAEYEAWFRDPHAVVKDMIGNPDYKDGFDVAPVQVHTSNGQRKYQNFMSGDWAWEEAVGHILKHISVTF